MKLALSVCVFFILFLSSCSIYDSTKVTGVDVKEDVDLIEIVPKSGVVNPTALMFYPGAFVNAGAYVEMFSKLGGQGIRTVIVKAPFGLMVLDPEKGLRFKSRFPSVSRWLISGHSLGGAMAATAVKKNPDTFSGIIFLAAYPAESDSLVAWGGKITSISASEDGLATPEKVDAAKKYLPSQTRYVQIAGGNHAQFGNYGKQNGDKDAKISSDEQQKIVLDEILKFF
jgi:dienelactone hydrolase